jgi:NAD(P)-dependent dehydrogenase (short-subunit alcohol dehydrogenase family)
MRGDIPDVNGWTEGEAPAAVGWTAHGRTGARRGNGHARSAGAPEPSAEPPDGRVALVSGGNRGLGLRIVRALAAHGLRVVLGSRSVDRGRLAVDLLGDLAGRVAVRQLDITDTASVERLVTWLAGRLGRCDVLVNNAAVLMDGDRNASRVGLDVVRRTLETNLLGTWRLTQAVAPLMRGRRYGRIVTISGHVDAIAATWRGPAAHLVSKSGVNSLTRMLAVELAPDGILVNAWCPGPVGIDPRVRRAASRLSASPETPVWLATLPDGGPTGRFYCERTPVEG